MVGVRPGWTCLGCTESWSGVLSWAGNWPPAQEIKNVDQHISFCLTLCWLCLHFCTTNSLFATFADLHVCKLATFADLHSYTQAYCSLIAQWNKKAKFTIISSSHCPHALLIWLFGIFPYDLQVKWYSELKIVLPKCRPNSNVPQNNVAHGGFVRGKQRVNVKVNGRKCSYCSSTEQWRKKNHTLIPIGSLVYRGAKLMHCIIFGLSIFTVQLFVVAYHIFCEINVAHKELKPKYFFFFYWKWKISLIMGFVYRVSWILKPRELFRLQSINNLKNLQNKIVL